MPFASLLPVHRFSGSNLLPKVIDKLVGLDAHLSTPLNVAGECCITLPSVTAQFEIVAAEGSRYRTCPTSSRLNPAVIQFTLILFADHVVAVAPVLCLVSSKTSISMIQKCPISRNLCRIGKATTMEVRTLATAVCLV